MKKKCVGCGQIKDRSCYRKRACASDGLNARCKRCLNGNGSSANGDRPGVSQFVRNYLEDCGPSLSREVQAAAEGQFGPKQVMSALRDMSQRGTLSRQDAGRYKERPVYRYSLAPIPDDPPEPTERLVGPAGQRKMYGWGD